jgi:hypothetical protein
MKTKIFFVFAIIVIVSVSTSCQRGLWGAGCGPGTFKSDYDRYDKFKKDRTCNPNTGLYSKLWER